MTRLNTLILLLLLVTSSFGQQGELDLGSATIESSATSVSIKIGGVEVGAFDDNKATLLADDGTVPAAQAGKAALVIDPADGKLKVRKSTGDGGGLVDLEAGAGSAISLEDEGTPVTGTPHGTLNFTGSGVTVTDAGAGEATVTITGSSANFEEEAFTPTLGQTVFTLANTYAGASKLSVACINSLCGYRRGVHYTVSGTTFTWLDTPFTLDTNDSLLVKIQTN